MNHLKWIWYYHMYSGFLTGTRAQEGEALLCLPAELSTQLGETAEPSETSRDMARSSDPRLARPCHTRTKHHSGSNVSFSHDTEGGEDDQTRVYWFVLNLSLNLSSFVDRVNGGCGICKKRIVKNNVDTLITWRIGIKSVFRETHSRLI